MKYYLTIGGAGGIENSLAQILAQKGHSVYAANNKTNPLNCPVVLAFTILTG